MISTIQNFQIPVTDFDRAHQFYSEIMEQELEVISTDSFTLGLFSFDAQKGVGGCIIKSEGLQPSKSGTLVYLHAGDDLQPTLEKLEAAGGSIYATKTALGPDMGFYAIFDDSEGNRVGLYSNG